MARAHAAILLAKLDACEDFLPGGDRDVAAVHGLPRDLVLTTRDLADPAWLEAASDDPDIAAFTALQATPAPARPGRTRRDHLPRAVGPLSLARRPARRRRPRIRARPGSW